MVIILLYLLHRRFIQFQTLIWDELSCLIHKKRDIVSLPDIFYIFVNCFIGVIGIKDQRLIKTLEVYKLKNIYWLQKVYVYFRRRLSFLKNSKTSEIFLKINIAQ